MGYDSVTAVGPRGGAACVTKACVCRPYSRAVEAISSLFDKTSLGTSRFRNRLESSLFIPAAFASPLEKPSSEIGCWFQTRT